MNINLDVALEVFTLGVKFGTLEGRHGFEPDKMEPEDVEWVLRRLVEMNLPAIEERAKKLIENDNRRSWYVEQQTCQTAFRFGMIEGFMIYPDCEEHKGEKFLTEEDIKSAIEKAFRGARGFDE